MISLTSDIADLILQRTLSYNTTGLNNSIQCMTSGYKLNHARDNAAGYSILTDLSTKISSMLQVQQNTSDGMSMLQTAEGGLEEIQTLLERLRELASQAANGTYDTQSRDAMQQEADEIIAEIERIKGIIEYNGMNLYETPKEDTLVTRLSNSAKVSAGANENDTISKTFTQITPASTAGRVNTLSAASLYSTSSQLSALASGDTIEGAVDFSGNETRTITIDGVEYTIKNRLATAQSISYTKDTAADEVTFYGSDFEIRGQKDAVHNVVINGSRNLFYGGDLNDTISTVSGTKSNYIYGEAGDDIITAYGSAYLYGGAGNDVITANITESSINGGDGDDVLNINGSVGSSAILGGAGNDIFNINASNLSNINGEAGDDTFNIIGNRTGLKIDGGSGTNVVTGNVGSNMTINVVDANTAEIALSANETKTVTIDGKEYTITSQSGSKVILYYQIDSGQIIFSKDSTNARITIEGEADKSHNVSLNSQYFTFYGGNKADIINIAANYCSVYGGDGDDEITTKQSVGSIIKSGDGNDKININTSSNYIDTGAGDDTVSISSSVNGNTIYSESGNNTISGNYKFTNFVSGFGASDTTDVQCVVFGEGETKTITIGGKEYTIQNNDSRSTGDKAFLYTYNQVTGEISFCGFQFKITGQQDVEHLVSLYGESMIFQGGNKDDNITNYAHSGNVYGYGGNDTITLQSSSSWSYAYGGDGDDNIIVNDGGAHVYGEAGDDTITINTAVAYEINGGSGNDTYNVNAKATGLIDAGGNNLYNINTSGANISGGIGNDTFYIKGDNNTILGAGGDDYFVIDGSNNLVDGGTGTNYYIDNGSGTSMSNVNRDPNSGGLSFTYQGEVKTFTLNDKTYTVTNNLSGTNTLQYSLNPNTGVITLNGSDLKIEAASNEQALINIRGDNNIVNGSSLADRITIEQGSNNVINGLDGNDTLTMNSENNSISGGNGNDNIILNASTNLLVTGGAGADTITINSDNNTNISSGTGNDVINVNGSNNNINAEDGNNTINVSKDGNTIKSGNGDNRFVITSSSNTITAGNGNNSLGIQGDSNNVTVQNASGDINIYGSNNTITNTRGENDVTIKGSGNSYSSMTGTKEITVTGNSNNILTGSGDDSITVKGNENTIESTGGTNVISIKGDTNIVQGGSGVDDIKINGNNNTANGGDSSDSFMISNGNNNVIDGESGERNTLIDNGKNTSYTNAVDITPRPFDVKIKVDIGSGEDKYISSSISFNLFDFSVDFSSAENALNSLESIDDMLKTVEEQLLNIGTTISRLESAAEAQTIKLNNLISSRSTIRDADIAEESSIFIRYQILQQASATLMSSSRNLKAQNVLGLLSNI